MAMVTPIVKVATITVDDTNMKSPITVDVDPIQTAPDLHIVFLVLNIGKKKHKVSIDRDRFQKKQAPPDAPGPDTPIEFELFARHSDHVDPGDVGAMILRIKHKGDFGGEPDPSNPRYYRYKYTIEASGLPDFDPDIGINN